MTPKIFFNMLLFTMRVSNVFFPLIKRLKDDAHIDGIVVPLFEGSTEEYLEIGEFLRRNELGAAAVTIATHQCDPSSYDVRVRKNAVDYFKDRIDWAQALGATKVSGPNAIPWGWWPEDFHNVGALRELIADRMNNAAPVLQEIGDYAAKKGILFGVERLTRWENAGLNTLKDLIAFLKFVDHPAVVGHVDTAHEIIDGNGPHAFKRAVAELANMNKLGVVEISAPHRGRIEESWIPWDDVIRPLIGAGWKDPIAIEIFDSAQPEFLKGVKLTRPAFPNTLHVATAAVAKVRQEWERVMAAIKPEPRFNDNPQGLPQD